MGGFCSGNSIGECEVVVIVRSTQTDEGGTGTLFQGDGVGVGGLESTRLIHEGVEGIV